MPLFKYDSFSRRGNRVTGTIDASTTQAAKELLRGQGLMPTSIEEVKTEASGFSLATLFEKTIDTKSKVLFTKQLAVLLRSGVPLLQAIELLSEQFEGPLHRILIEVKDGIKTGNPFATCLARYPKVFPNVYVQLVKAGEASGKLEIILERLTTYLERAEETRKKIRSAMTYPIAIMSFALLIVILVLIFLVPTMTEMFSKTGKELPLPTQILKSSSEFVLEHYFLLFFGIVGSLFGFLKWKSTPSGRLAFDELILRLPLFAYFSKTKAVVQFSKTLGMLLEAGVNLSEALDIVCNIVDNNVLTFKLKQARDKIIKEGKIAKYLKETGMFPSIASYMINTGEQSGKLAEMLLTVGNDYDVELSELTDSLTAAISPVMTIVIAVIIVFIIAAIFMPVMDLSDSMSNF